MIIHPSTNLDAELEPGYGEPGLHILIVGGGQLAFQQLEMLFNRRSVRTITVVSEFIDDRIKKAARELEYITLELRGFDKMDLVKANLVIAASGNDLVNKRVEQAAADQRIFSYPVSLSVVVNDKIFSNTEIQERDWKKIATWCILAFGLMIVGHLIISALPVAELKNSLAALLPSINKEFLFFILAGFIAQMVDGALSMGYGVTSATFLMSFGVSPVSVSAAIHTSEIFTSGISGYSHYKFGNVNKKLFRHLVIPGIIGAIAGALLLVFLGERAGKWLMPLIALYALFLGCKILVKAFQKNKPASKVKRVGWLAGAGGFLDSFGGGGWGPIVTSTLISKGRSPKYTIGTVSLTEFFITLASAATFFITVGVHHWNIVVGLIIGGAVAAPFAAKLAGKLPKKTMMIAVGVMIIIWCARIIVKSFF